MMDKETRRRLNAQLLEKAIAGERGAIAEYERLKFMTDDKAFIATFGGIIDDETKHLRCFEELYRKHFGVIPDIPIPESKANDLMNGLHMAVEDELAAYEFYRNLYIDNGGENIRMLFFEAMTDENEHAIRLNTMISRELEKRIA